MKPKVTRPKQQTRKHILSVADNEDRELLKGKSVSYIIGWNKVKKKVRSNT